MRSCETNKVPHSTCQNVCLNYYNLFDREVKGISSSLSCVVLSLFLGNSLCTCMRMKIIVLFMASIQEHAFQFYRYGWCVKFVRILFQIERIKISFDGGKTSMNFAEAALVIQGSACIYSKKVFHHDSN